VKHVLVYVREEPTDSVIEDESFAVSVIRVDSVNLMMEGQVHTTLYDIVSQNKVTIVVNAMEQSTPASKECYKK